MAVTSSSSSRKLIDKLRAINNDEKRPFYSFEYFPPKTAAGVANLYARIEHMAQLEPAFIDVTWGAGGTTSELTMEISANAQAYAGVDVMMHLTCTNMPQEKLRIALEDAKRAGIRNILALRGDPPRDADSFEACAGGFSYATDLVRFIRAEFGDYFCICVSGYPEGHLECTSLDDDLLHLKEKADAGADFIITQLFYDVDIFLQFVQRCRGIGLNFDFSISFDFRLDNFSVRFVQASPSPSSPASCPSRTIRASSA
jgi:methylenetetrahydrofolate reductase (NADPH)